jgi:hypothetical protein
VLAVQFSKVATQGPAPALVTFAVEHAVSAPHASKMPKIEASPFTTGIIVVGSLERSSSSSSLRSGAHGVSESDVPE